VANEVRRRHGVPIEEWANELYYAVRLSPSSGWSHRETECE